MTTITVTYIDNQYPLPTSSQVDYWMTQMANLTMTWIQNWTCTSGNETNPIVIVVQNENSNTQEFEDDVNQFFLDSFGQEYQKVLQISFSAS